MLIWAKIVAGLLDAFHAFMRWREQAAQRKAGRNEERLKVTEAENEAQRKMDAVDAGRGERTVVDRLRDGGAI